MSTSFVPPFSPPEDWTLADLFNQVGQVPMERIRLVPAPGTACEEDVIRAERAGHLCELVDGVLIEKTMGYCESAIAARIIFFLQQFVVPRKLGMVLSSDGTLRILPGQVRIPDVSFIGWHRFPGGKRPAAPIPALAPDLAIEVLSPSNTRAEMDRKLRDYFAAGVRLVWYVDPATRSAKAYTAPDQCAAIGADGALGGGDVLPGFELPLQTLLDETAAE
jgi:Uma2 family endonuclease